MKAVCIFVCELCDDAVPAASRKSAASHEEVHHLALVLMYDRSM